MFNEGVIKKLNFFFKSMLNYEIKKIRKIVIIW